MMMIIMGFTGFPAWTVATQSSSPKFSYKAKFSFFFFCTVYAKEHVCTKGILRNPTIKPNEDIINAKAVTDKRIQAEVQTFPTSSLFSSYSTRFKDSMSQKKTLI